MWTSRGFISPTARTCFGICGASVSYTHLDVYKRQGEQGVEEKGKTGQTDPAPAGSPAEQEGEEHHGGDVHKALEGEKGSHFPAAAAQILDNLIGKTHENIVAGVEKNHPGQ